MHKYILRRLLMLMPVMLGVSFIVFTMMHITPGDPARIMLGESAPLEEVEKFREELGLNDPFLIQYGRFVKNLVIHQDMGRSYTSKRPVIEEILIRFPTTLKLATLGIVVAVLLGIPAGIISATRQYSIFDNTSMVAALLGVSMPNFWQGLMLILLFSVKLGWLPSSGFSSWKEMILPALTLGTSSAAIITRMTRSSMLEVIRQDYIRTARAKGQVESVVVNRHALKNALIPIVTVIGLQFGYLLGGAVLTESIFSISGVGRLMVESISARNFPVVQGGVLFIALTFSIVNLLVDILYAFLDPRIKSQYK
ncbi:peptide/nickel transport system permease protein [Anaerovirgula multivorans]|uniref:Nickel import system permease protein NikB n=1 Tax=Anaerovirgula multivorans TaxID=312168 RepID=A0A239FHB7_9FIRM|nr:nickel ABC transporter permease [Anaerovirgula multivorans]SNS56316.1 peptide/nickel transport system permease protein [Anaerovirgula multivorans]